MDILLEINRIMYYSKKMHFAIILLISTAFFLIIYWVFIHPKFLQLTQLRQQELILRNTFERLHYQGSSPAEYRQQIDKIILTAGKSFHQFKVKKISNVLRYLIKIIHVSGLTIQSFIPTAPNQRQNLFIELKLTGGFSEWILFLEKLSTTKYGLMMKDFSIESLDDKGAMNKETLIFNMKIVTRYHD